MTRTRAPIDGGYARKTVSLPQALVNRIEKHLRKKLKRGESVTITVNSEDADY